MDRIADVMARNTEAAQGGKPMQPTADSTFGSDSTRTLGSLSADKQAQALARMNSRMTAIFGHRWSGSMDTEALDVWRRSLLALSLDDIRRGLDQVVAWSQGHDGWPPNLPEFLVLCRPAVKPACHRDYRENMRALPAPAKVTAPGDARAHLQNIRDMLRPKAPKPGGGAS